ncbi:hypothetical protein IAT38_002472 [Cryptococcus sp. DSM 104549]
MAVPRDVREFLESYPGAYDNPSASSNLRYYSNQLRSRPDNLFYEDFMRKHAKDYDELELNHGYIQWLFPIREHGVNPQAQPLEVHEIEAMSGDPEIHQRLLRSYQTMLGFYGIDFNGGKLQLADNSAERLRNLRNRPHNLLRLTRILKHLSEFPSLQPHAAPLVLAFVAMHSEGQLDFSQGTMRGDSMDKWWSNCFRDEEERKEVRGYVKGRGQVGDGKWGWEKFGAWYDARAEAGKTGFTGEQ